MTFRTIAAIALSSFFVVGCESTATTAPSKSPIDVSDLSTRERATYERMVDESIAPCPDQAVTLDVCLNEKRACNACPLAAQFLVERVKAGLDKTAIRESYKKRFTTERAQVELGNSPSLGPVNAPVTIVVWSDFECPHCQHVVPIIERLQETHANDVRLVHKFYPLPRHTNAKIAARVAWAAQQQGKYWEMERLLFENQKNLGEQTILELAASLGLDMARVKVDMDSEGAAGAIKMDMAEAEKHGLDGTPFVMINGREFDFRLFQPEQDLDSWIATEIALAKNR